MRIAAQAVLLLVPVERRVHQRRAGGIQYAEECAGVVIAAALIGQQRAGGRGKAIPRGGAGAEGPQRIAGDIGQPRTVHGDRIAGGTASQKRRIGECVARGIELGDEGAAPPVAAGGARGAFAIGVLPA